MTVVAAIKAQKKDLNETILMKTRLDLRNVIVKLDDGLVSWREHPHLYLLFLSLSSLSSLSFRPRHATNID
jgi:hypothetical protein